jgi:hypothetical protein
MLRRDAMAAVVSVNFQAGFPRWAWEATVKDYDVAVARPQGHSRALHLSIGRQRTWEPSAHPLPLRRRIQRLGSG